MQHTLSSPVELRRLRHDLRTPINHIMGYSQLIAEETQDPQVTEDLQKIRGAARTLLMLIDENLPPDGEQPLVNGTAATDDKFGTLRHALSVNAAPREVTPATLLVVDDNEINRDLVSRWLTARGYNVLTASGGHQALGLLEDRSIDMVLLDILMPDVSGFDVLQTLRRTRSLAELPVIMVTSMAESQDTVRFLQLGANDYVTKPIDLPILQARIETHLTVKRLSELKDEFMGIASHDLKNPLSVVIGCMQLLAEDNLTKESMNVVNIVSERAIYMQRIIADFLDFQVLNAGAMALDLSALDLADVAREALENQAGNARAKAITMELQEDGRHVLVEADLSRLHQVVDNLVSNAIKFSGRSSHVVLQTRSDADGVELSVIDSGPGLREADLAKLFVRYARLSNRPTGGESSTGLGLAICKQIVELHGGTIGARNNADKDPLSGSEYRARAPFRVFFTPLKAVKRDRWHRHNENTAADEMEQVAATASRHDYEALQSIVKPLDRHARTLDVYVQVKAVAAREGRKLDEVSAQFAVQLEALTKAMQPRRESKKDDETLRSTAVFTRVYELSRQVEAPLGDIMNRCVTLLQDERVGTDEALAVAGSAQAMVDPDAYCTFLSRARGNEAWDYATLTRASAAFRFAEETVPAYVDTVADLFRTEPSIDVGQQLNVLFSEVAQPANVIFDRFFGHVQNAMTVAESMALIRTFGTQPSAEDLNMYEALRTATRLRSPQTDTAAVLLQLRAITGETNTSQSDVIQRFVGLLTLNREVANALTVVRTPPRDPGDVRVENASRHVVLNGVRVTKNVA